MTLLQERGGFMLRAIGLMLAELLVTFALFQYQRTNADFGERVAPYWWVFALLGLLCIIVLCLVPMPPAAKLALFTLYSVSVGLMLSRLRGIPAERISEVFFTIALIFVVMVGIGYVYALSGIDLSFMGVILSGVLTGAIVVLLGLLVFPSESIHRFFATWILVPLFSVFIVFDTNMIMMGQVTDIVDAALSYYLDVINLFVNLND